MPDVSPYGLRALTARCLQLRSTEALVQNARHQLAPFLRTERFTAVDAKACSKDFLTCFQPYASGFQEEFDAKVTALRMQLARRHLDSDAVHQWFQPLEGLLARLCGAPMVSLSNNTCEGNFAIVIAPDLSEADRAVLTDLLRRCECKPDISLPYEVFATIWTSKGRIAQEPFTRMCSAYETTQISLPISEDCLGIYVTVSYAGAWCRSISLARVPTNNTVQVLDSLGELDVFVSGLGHQMTQRGTRQE